MFNYKISPATRSIFLAVWHARIFLIKIKISGVLNFHLASFSGSVRLHSQAGVVWCLAMAQKQLKEDSLRCYGVSSAGSFTRR
jgi:hypothetical protein